jgi:hypothetical protein
MQQLEAGEFDDDETTEDAMQVKTEGDDDEAAVETDVEESELRQSELEPE